MNLAPVLDVNSNPRNPVIGIRSFGADPATVAELGVAYIRGLESAGVLAVAKHFPSHGDTDADSHYHLPVLPHDHDRLLAVELFPFARAFAEGLPAVMTAHIALPAVAEGDIPATVSSRVLTDLLRTELGYDGLVITDGLEMQGIVEKYGSGEAAVRAVVAGADMVMVLWFPEKKREVREKLLDAVRSGRIPRARLDQAVRRVLTAKARHGLFETFSPPSVDDERAREQRRSAVTREIAERAVTIVKNDRGVLPLHQGTTVLAAATEPLFLSELQKTLQVQAFTLSQAPTTARLERDAAQLIAQARRADVIVIGMMNSDHAVLVHRVRRAHPNKKLVVVSFGTPYLLSHVGDVDAYVCAFGWREESERAAGQVLVGKKPPRGRMPVTLPGVMTAGSQTLLMSSPTPARPVVVR